MKGKKHFGLGLLIVLSAAAIVAGPGLLNVSLDSLQSNVRHFGSVAELRRAFGTNQWAAADFLPSGCFDIREEGRADQHAGRVAAKFPPTEYPALALSLTDVPVGEWDLITPGWGNGVLPRRLTHGDFNGFAAEGFRIAAVAAKNSAQRWYVAVDQVNGVIYGWSVNRIGGATTVTASGKKDQSLVTSAATR